MFKFNTLHHKTLHKTLINHLKTLTTQKPLQTLNPSPISHQFCTFTPNSSSTPFPVTYLINKFSFSPQSASNLCSIYGLKFKTNQQPDAVVAFFKNYGFSDTQIHDIILKLPELLKCNPEKRVLPKFQFFLSKGASMSDIVKLISKNPRVLSRSLENHVIPMYELVYRFLKSHKETIAVLIRNPVFHCERRVSTNIRLLIESGVAEANVARLICIRSQILGAHDLMKFVEEVKGLGFNPKKIIFSAALCAKASGKTLWKKKVDEFKKWGWSEEDALEAFKKIPYCMLTSVDKINLVMSFWVNQLGWDAMEIAKTPYILGLSLEKRIVPRAEIVQFLLKNGLRKKNASLTCPFVVPEKMFIDMCINRYKESSSYLLKLYEEKLNLPFTQDKTCMS